MSLINDMLRDLDARRGRPDGPDAIALQGMGLVTAPVSTPFPLLHVGAGVLVLVLAAGGGLLAWQQLRTAPPAEITVDHEPVTHDLVPATPVIDVVKVEAPHEAEPVVMAVAPETVVEIPPAVVEPEPAETPIETPPEPITLEAPKQEPVIRRTLRQPTPLEQAEQAYQQAAAALRGHDTAKAIGLLEEALALTPRHAQARITLAGLYVRDRRTDLALELLAEGFAMAPDSVEQARLYGHLLLQADRDAEARTVLETAAPSAGGQPDYQALLGTLYQRLNMPAQAAEHYRAALALDSRQGAWWLGLGMALEQLRRSDAARDAYSRALQRPLAANVKTYIEERLAALGG